MAATEQNFVFFAGEDVDATVGVIDVETGLPKALTGSTVIWKAIRPRTCEVVAEKGIGDGIELTDPDNGIFTIILTHDETASFLAGRYDHYACVTDALGNVSVVTVGVMTVKKLGG